MAESKYPLFKFIIIGESGVGKSCLLLRYTKSEFRQEYDVTIGVEFSSKTVDIDENTKLKLQIWDTAGQESFRSIVRSFYRNVSAVFVVYNIARKETLQRLEDWIKEARDNSGPNVVIVLVGAQNDRESERQVSYEEGKDFMNQNELNLFFETSSKNDSNVELVIQNIFQKNIKAFIETAKLVFLNYLSSQIQGNRESKVSIALTDNQDRRGVKLLNEEQEQKQQSKCC